jgi:hypothetical protein
MSTSDYLRSYLFARWKWSIKGIAGTCSLVSFAAGAAVAIAVWLSPNWAHQHISERMNAVVLGVIPLAVGASVFLFRWFISPYPIYKKLRAQIDAKQSREKIRRQLYSYLLDLEDRITDLQKLDASAIIMFEMTPAEIDGDNKQIDEIFHYITDNISLSVAGGFLSSTGLSQARGNKMNLHEHIKFLTNRAIRLKRIVDDL